MDQIDLKQKPEENKLDQTLAELGESELINRLGKFMDFGQINDDTAVIKNPNKDLLINTDVLVENVHFSTQTSSPESIGWKAITTNLSDLISSGAIEFISFSVGLIAPPQTEWKWIEGVYQGMQNALNEFGGKISGGDCSQGHEKILAITAIGELGALRLHRSNAKPGDYLVASGPHGLSRLGLALLTAQSLENFQELPTSLKEMAIEAHQRPSPQIELLKHLTECKPKDLPMRAAGTDSSDGLLKAVQNICFSSKCQAVLFKRDLPQPDYWPKGSPWDEWCINGGEDYEIILSLPPSWANSLIKTMPNMKKIGLIKEGLSQVLWDNGKEINMKKYPEYKHF